MSNPKKNVTNKPKSKDRWLLISILVCALAIIGMAAVMAYKFTPRRGEFVPPPFDAAAVVGTPDVPDTLGYAQVDAHGVFLASACGKLPAGAEQVDVWFTNPDTNTVWLKLRMLDEKGKILGETGLIRPGEYVQTISLDAPLASGQTVTMKIMAYMPDTYESAGAVSLKPVIS